MYLIEDIVTYKPDNKRAVVEEIHQREDGSMVYVVDMSGKKEVAIDEELEYIYDL